MDLKDDSVGLEAMSVEQELPKLKFARLTNDVTDILAKHPATCLSVHPKFICIGTNWGSIHLLDHEGNNVRNCKGLKGHSVAINRISIDEQGDFVASCSDDGIVHICGLYTSDNNHDLNIGRLVKSIAIDPLYHRSGLGRRFITGDERLVLHEKTFLSRLKSTVVGEAEGCVQSISWGRKFIAWASDIGVRVYDIQNRCSLGLMKWTQNPQALPQHYRCNMAWADNTTLLIGWVDTVRVCTIRARSPSELNNTQLPAHVVVPVHTFTTDFYISGIAPLNEAPDLEGSKEFTILLLGYAKELDEEGCARRPTVQIVQPVNNDYIEVARPHELMLREYQKHQCNDYHLEAVPQENRFFIVAPKDIVLASVYDSNDKVAWLIKHGLFEQALEAVKDAHKYSALEVGRAYIDNLLLQQEYDKAGILCLKVLGKDKKLWEEEVYKFAKIHQLKAISGYLPVGDNRLDKQVYEMVLYEYLKTDSQGFLKLVKEWSPTLYHVPAVVNTVIEHIIVTGVDNPVLLEALAVLYTLDMKYDRALAMYLKLKSPGIFSLIHNHNLYSLVVDKVEDLMQLDADQAVALFLENNCIPVPIVVSKLQHNRYFLYRYLDALDRKEPMAEACRAYHGHLIELHADFGRDKLLPFLRRSDHYSIQDALTVCQDRGYYREIVHLLGVMGKPREALQLMMDKLQDIHQAIDFCKEQDDPDLWQELIEQSLNKPEFITYLLRNTGTVIDPTLLVQRIAPGFVIKGLKDSLCKMMKDYRLQVSVHEGCKGILVGDYFNLQARLVATQKRGVRVDDESVCGVCSQRVLMRGGGIAVFCCRHVFHEACFEKRDRCVICYSTPAK